MTRDGHIRLLPLHVANKIAAGEVVERPASVLKELVENSIDAGATRIDVSISAGGRKLVEVRDNGCGMARDDALMSLERQATSKIRDVDDIERIDTLGFRGEAIPSIASVSRFTLVTRPADADEATRLVVNAGTLAEVASCGAPPGTRVEVRDLFCNVPARRKFLRAYATEEAHIKNIFAVNAIAHPSVAMSLSIDGREVWRFAENSTLEERIAEIYGPDFPDGLIKVNWPDSTQSGASSVSVHGYVEHPGRQTSFRREQCVFINGRPATANVISYAIRDAYPNRPGDARPTAILFIDLPPEQVDVNVHPAKREVRFRRPSDVRDAISQALASALGMGGPRSVAATGGTGVSPVLAPDESSTGRAHSPSAPPEAPHFIAAPFQMPIQPALHRPESNDAPQLQSQEQLPTAPSVPSSPSSPSLTPPIATAAGPWRWFEFLAQSSTGFLILETDAGLVTVHPQSALERIIYERLLASDAHTASQPLLIPETVQLSPLESAKIDSFHDVLSAQGFQIERFGHNIWKIDAVPQALGASGGVGNAIAAIAHDIAENGGRRGGARWREELVARAAARAVSGTMPRFTPETARQLIDKLAACRMPYVCPRGRPIMIFTSNRELSRKFGLSH